MHTPPHAQTRRVSAAAHDAHHRGAHAPHPDALTRGGNDACELETGNLMGRGERIGIHPHPLQQIGTIHGRGPHVDENLVGPGGGIWHLDDTKNLWSTVFGEHHRTHGSGHLLLEAPVDRGEVVLGRQPRLILRYEDRKILCHLARLD